MNTLKMTSLQRVLTTLGHQEPDRVPFFLFLTMHGAKELGLSIQHYFSKAEYVVEGQIRLRKKFQHDCLYAFFYASIEVEAWGAEVIYSDDGPPNSGEPFIQQIHTIPSLEIPDVKNTPCLLKVLKTISMLKEKVRDDAPIIGVVMSPFSLPVMQMGFETYIKVLYEHPQLFQQLMKLNEEFCVHWANAQLEVGATAICYFDPISSPTMIPKDLYLKTGYLVAQRTIRRIHGPTTIHMASGRCLPILEDIAATGTTIVGTSSLEDLSTLKSMCQGKLSILGNLNGIEMVRWTPEQAERMVKESIAKAAKRGGYILADNHGEIPFQVPDDVLLTISEVVHTWGRYPLDWLEGDHA